MIRLNADDEAILVTLVDGVATVTLHRPGRMNALDTAGFAELKRAVDEVAASEANVLVLTGEGRAFGAGGDLREDIATGSIEEQVAALREKAAVVEAIGRAPQLTVAAVNGACAGAAVGIAGACNLRYLSESAFVSTAYSSLGRSGDFGVAYFLTQLIGAAAATDWMLRQRRISSSECLRRGFANDVFPDTEFRAKVDTIVQQLASYDAATRAAVFQNVADSQTRQLGDYLDVESRRHIDSKQRVPGQP